MDAEYASTKWSTEEEEEEIFKNWINGVKAKNTAHLEVPFGLRIALALS